MTPTRSQVGRALALYSQGGPSKTFGLVIIRMRQRHKWFRMFDKTYENVVWVSAADQQEAVRGAMLRMRLLHGDCSDFSVVRTEGW